MANPYDTLGVPKNASADEIKKAFHASSRASTIPTRAAATRRASRRSRAPTTCSPTPRSARPTTRSARRTAVPAHRAGRSSRTSTSPISSAIFGGAARQRGPVPERGADVETHTTLSFEDALAAPRCACRSSSRPPVTAAQAPAPSRAPRPPSARSAAAAVSSPTPRAVLALAPAPLPRQRHHHRASLQDVPAAPPRAHHEELQRQDQARDQGPRPDPRRRQGRGGTERRPRRRPLRRRPRPARRSTPAAATI